MCLLSCFLVPSAAPHLVHCPLIPLEDIRAATENFSEARQIGEGAFGMVYRGTASDGTEWAVKRAKLMTNAFEMEVRGGGHGVKGVATERDGTRGDERIQPWMVHPT